MLEHGLVRTGAAVRPHLSVVVDFDTLRRAIEGPAGRGVGGPGEQRPGDGAPWLFRLDPVADTERFAVAEILG